MAGVRRTGSAPCSRRGNGQRELFYPRQVCFEAQQAVEKAIKALCVLHEVDFSFTHDLVKLMQLLVDVEAVYAPGADLEWLTQWATAARYPGGTEAIWPTPSVRSPSPTTSSRRRVRRCPPRDTRLPRRRSARERRGERLALRPGCGNDIVTGERFGDVRRDRVVLALRNANACASAPRSSRVSVIPKRYGPGVEEVVRARQRTGGPTR